MTGRPDPDDPATVGRAVGPELRRIRRALWALAVLGAAVLALGAAVAL